MKIFIFLLTGIISGYYCKAQTAEDSVKAVVNKMFSAMKNADPVMLASTFADSVVFQTVVKDKTGNIKVVNESAKGFIDFISKEQKGNADEQIVFETVKVDGPLASVWAPYKFYYKGQFSHCGIDAFQLVKFAGQWKIQ